MAEAKLQELTRTSRIMREMRNESWQREDHAIERVHELENQVRDLELYNEAIQAECHRLTDLMNPDHQPQAV